MNSYAIGDSVRYIPGYRGYFDAIIVSDDDPSSSWIIEFFSGLQISAREDELEER